MGCVAPHPSKIRNRTLWKKLPVDLNEKLCFSRQFLSSSLTGTRLPGTCRAVWVCWVSLPLGAPTGHLTTRTGTHRQGTLSVTHGTPCNFTFPRRVAVKKEKSTRATARLMKKCRPRYRKPTFLIFFSSIFPEMIDYQREDCFFCLRHSVTDTSGFSFVFAVSLCLCWILT